MRVIDSSRYVTTLHCKRERFIEYELLNYGLSPQVVSEDLQFGLGIHAGAEAIILGRDWVQESNEQFNKIQGTTIDGLSRMDEMKFMGHVMLIEFRERFLPIFKAKYEILHTELEILHEFHPGYGWMSRPDLVVREWGQETRLNVNYKTSSYPGDLLTNSKYALQLLMEAEAIRATTKEYVGGTVIVAFDKGYKSKITKKEKEEGKSGYRRMSPLTYAWTTGTNEHTGEIHFALSYAAKHQRVPVFTIMTPLEWWEYLDKHHPTVLRNQIFSTPVISHATEKTESVKTQILAEEMRIEKGVRDYEAAPPEHKNTVLDEYFPQNFDNCLNHHGYRGHCPFLDYCHTVGVSDKPLYHYTLRTPNHPVENSIIEARINDKTGV